MYVVKRLLHDDRDLILSTQITLHLFIYFRVCVLPLWVPRILRWSGLGGIRS